MTSVGETRGMARQGADEPPGGAAQACMERTNLGGPDTLDLTSPDVEHEGRIPIDAIRAAPRRILYRR
jgi:hypothetical protein